MDWLPSAYGKFVLFDVPQPTGRPDSNWEEYATDASFEKMLQNRSELTQNWRSRVQNTGLNSREYIAALENAGAAGIIISNWAGGFSSNRIFSASTRKIPSVDLSLEDYGMLYRMVENGYDPEIRIRTESRELGAVPTFNTIAEIPGSEIPGEYIILSAHFDSWDGATGATDNATGSVTMMEVARILKKVYPNPKRTILVGLWGSEEQGLNGSRAYVKDNPGIVDGIQAVFNQDNGTGRVSNISGQGFLHSYEYLSRWLEEVPNSISRHIDTNFPGMPSGGGSDHSSFVAAGAPAFMLSSLSWDYWNYTWHTTLDTFDKLIFDDLRKNIVLIAMLAYMASEDPNTFNREKRAMPVNPRTGEQAEWPTPRSPNRSGGLE